MREVICPKCGANYEQHPLDQAHQELCPACRNKASWDDIRDELANASKIKVSRVVSVSSAARSGPRAGV